MNKKNKKKLNEQIDSSKWVTVEEAKEMINDAFLHLEQQSQ